jgi:hypothetical protein
MSGENYLQRYTIEGLTKRFSACFVTKHNDITPGVPDLSVFVKLTEKNTWIELKAKPQFPQNLEKPVHFDHYTEHQALFLRQRKGWLFIRVKRIYFLFNSEQAWRFWESGGFTKAAMSENATVVWHGAVNWKEFVETIGKVAA